MSLPKGGRASRSSAQWWVSLTFSLQITTSRKLLFSKPPVPALVPWAARALPVPRARAAETQSTPAPYLLLRWGRQGFSEFLHLYQFLGTDGPAINMSSSCTIQTLLLALLCLNQRFPTRAGLAPSAKLRHRWPPKPPFAVASPLPVHSEVPLA